MQRDDPTHHERRTPAPDSFHDAVVDEDPTRWGARSDATVARPTTTASDVGATYVPPPTSTSTRERVVATERARPPVDAEPPVGARRFSLGATFLGWAVAAFFTIVFSAIVLTLIGGAEAQDGAIDLESVALTSFIGYLVAAFLAYLLGGYAAGRIALWNGVWHGLGTVAWAILFAIVGIVGSAYVADTLDLGARIDLSNVTTGGLLAIGLSLLAMLAGAALGGRMGERYHELARDAAARRRVGRTRSRPL